MQIKQLFLAALLFVVFFACNKNEDPVREATISITADVDGISFQSIKKEKIEFNNNVLIVEGSDWVNNHVYIKIEDISDTGDFNIKSSGEASFVFADDIETEYSTSTPLGSGIITVNELSDSKISGTFSYMASLDGSQRQVEVSQGKFSAEY